MGIQFDSSGNASEITELSLRNLDHGFDLPAGEVGVTIRSGNKWMIEAGKTFQLVEQYSDGREERVVGKGMAVGCVHMPFKHIPGNLLKIEHNDAARDRETCLQMMRAGYGDDFTEETYCTALIYYRMS